MDICRAVFLLLVGIGAGILIILTCQTNGYFGMDKLGEFREIVAGKLENFQQQLVQHNLSIEDINALVASEQNRISLEMKSVRNETAQRMVKLEAIINSHTRQLATLDTVEISLEELIQYKFQLTPNLPDVMNYIRDNISEDQQSLAYQELASLFKNDSSQSSKFNWTFKSSCPVYRIPELRSLIPSSIETILSNATKIIKPRQNIFRYLTIANYKLTTTNIRNMESHWRFQAVDDDCEYFTISQIPSDMAIGAGYLASASYPWRSTLIFQLLRQVRMDPRYHWQVQHLNGGFYRFVNKGTDLVLGIVDSVWDVNLVRMGADSRQDWTIMNSMIIYS